MAVLFRYLLSPRGLVALGLVLAACWFTTTHVSHHEGSNAFETLYLHLMPAKLVVDSHHPAEGENVLLDLGRMTPTNLQVFQVASVLLCFVCFLGVPSYVRTGRGGTVSKLFAGFATWVRDEMVYPVMGKEEGRKYLPYFLAVFFFIMFMNVTGLFPGSATATASIFVTGGLALTTLAGMLVCGMLGQGVVPFWKNLVPHVPAFMWPLMFFVELIGLFVKPFALMIRLFANMTGGHMVVLSFLGLIFFFAGRWGDAAGYGAAPIAIAFGVFIMIIEAFVALLQAYIFTQLSIIFIGASIHPEH